MRPAALGAAATSRLVRGDAGIRAQPRLRPGLPPGHRRQPAAAACTDRLPGGRGRRAVGPSRTQDRALSRRRRGQRGGAHDGDPARGQRAHWPRRWRSSATSAALRHVTELAGMDRATAAELADALAGANILEPTRPLRFVHPLVRSTIYEIPATGPPGARPRAGGGAARRWRCGTGAAGRAPDRERSRGRCGGGVARCPTRHGKPTARGAPDVAATYLRRALAEPPPPERAPAIALDLGLAEVAALDPQGPPRLLGALTADGRCARPAGRGASCGQHARQLPARRGLGGGRQDRPGIVRADRPAAAHRPRGGPDHEQLVPPANGGARRRAPAPGWTPPTPRPPRSSSAARSRAPGARAPPPKPGRCSTGRWPSDAHRGPSSQLMVMSALRGHLDRRLRACGEPVAGADRRGPCSGHAQRRPRELHVAQPHPHHAGRPRRGQGGPGQRAGARVARQPLAALRPGPRHPRLPAQRASWTWPSASWRRYGWTRCSAPTRGAPG